MNKRGFTLIEILIVITLIALLSTIAVINYEKTRRNIEFTNVFLNISENLRLVRSNAITSRTLADKVPFAYDVQFRTSTAGVETTIFADSDVSGSQQFVYDTSKGDTKVRDYNLPPDYTASIEVKKSLNSEKSIQLNKVNIGFMPPFGDVYISDDNADDNKDTPPEQYSKIQIKITLNEVNLSRYICLNTIGSVIEESVFECITTTL
ncbi:prepilin-type N-terminal cleavage/methylation domain-containing protein [Patescibacteria group bacterium]|nr:prepilin-type N-terminal cleavage/methylation domain-containing protein [Patescibacteria group bacterium]